MSNDSNTTYLGFSPHNFYYVDATSRNAQYAPNDSSCNEVYDNSGAFNNLICDKDTFPDNSFNCLKKEMCNNKKLANSLKLEFNNTGSDIRYLDNQKSYNIYLIKIVNLIVGISTILYFMYKNNPK